MKINLEEKAEAINELSSFFLGDKEDEWEGTSELVGKKVAKDRIDFCSYYNETLAKAFPELVTIKKNFFTGVSSVKIENTEQLKKELKKLYKKDINVIIK